LGFGVSCFWFGVSGLGFVWGYGGWFFSFLEFGFLVFMVGFLVEVFGVSDIVFFGSVVGFGCLSMLD
jgi:hypothetical protein